VNTRNAIVSTVSDHDKDQGVSSVRPGQDFPTNQRADRRLAVPVANRDDPAFNCPGPILRNPLDHAIVPYAEEHRSTVRIGECDQLARHLLHSG